MRSSRGLLGKMSGGFKEMMAQLNADLRGVSTTDEILSEVDRVRYHTYKMAWIYNRTSEFWEDYKEVSENLKSYLLDGATSAWPSVRHVEETYPLLWAMRETHLELPMRIILANDGSVPYNILEISKGYAATNFDSLFHGRRLGAGEPNPVDLIFDGVEVEPEFRVKVSDSDAENLKEDYTLRMNERTFNRIAERGSAYHRGLVRRVKRRGYTIESNEPFTMKYSFRGIPERMMEMPPLEL